MGSGTKPFTAAAIMQLVDQGKLKTSDLASQYIDGPMKRMFNTTMVELFGPMAANITVDNIFRMNSGLNDFECHSCNFDTPVLINSTNSPQEVHSPMESF
jgi:CubicO group peptidase (beta-lactamase class C family)